MRLIDADALNLALGKACDEQNVTPRGMLNRFDLAAILDAALTVCCERCHHDQYPRMCGGRVLQWCQWESDKSMTEWAAPFDACSNFKEATR